MAQKTILITGGNAGIALATALRFARGGVNVTIVGRRDAANQAARRQIEALGVKCLALAGDVTDEAFMRAMDALRVFPSIILALAVVAAAGPSLLNVVLVLGFLDAPVFARVVRAEVLSLRGGTFVEAAIAAGNPTWRILFVHLMPNALRGAIAQSAVRAAWAVRISATLAFLGVGIQPPTPEWGAMIRQGAEYMVSGEWWVAVFPGAALVVMVLGLNMLGDGIADLMDPRRRAASGAAK